MARIAIVDGNNISYRLYSAFKEGKGGLLKTSLGVSTTVIFGMFRTFEMLSSKFIFDRIILCWDITGSFYRRRLYPLYKKHRKYIDMTDYFQELDTARKYFKSFGVTQCKVKGIEADDVVGYISNYLKDKGHKIIIVGDDKDFYQLLTDGIKIYRPIKDMVIDKILAEDDIGYNPKLRPKIKAITGEDGDFIPGSCDVDEKEMKLIKCRLGEKTALKLLEGKKNLSDAIDNCIDEKWKERLQSKKNQILISYKLAKIRIKFEKYKKWEQKRLLKLNDIVLNEQIVSFSKVKRLKEDLELTSVDVISVLKKMGIKVV